MQLLNKIQDHVRCDLQGDAVRWTRLITTYMWSSVPILRLTFRVTQLCYWAYQFAVLKGQISITKRFRDVGPPRQPLQFIPSRRDHDRNRIIYRLVGNSIPRTVGILNISPLAHNSHTRRQAARRGELVALISVIYSKSYIYRYDGTYSGLKALGL